MIEADENGVEWRVGNWKGRIIKKQKSKVFFTFPSKKKEIGVFV